MQRVAVTFTAETDIIVVPDEIAESIKRYQIKFDKWLYDKENDHPYWVIIDGKKRAVSFGTEAFVDYLNTFWMTDPTQKSTIVEKAVKNIPNNIPQIYF